VSADDVALVEDFYARRSGPTRLTVCPWSDASLFEALAARGYRAIQFDNVLARPLGPIESFAPPAAGVAVKRALPGEVLDWGRLVRAGMGIEVDEERAAAIDGALEGSPHAILFIATVDGEPAGGGGLLIYDSVATLFAAATIPKYRRRGVQGALIAARLACARDAGADMAITLTDPGSDSQRNMEARFGFRVGYTATVLESRAG
jgi:GNAT superfamily N-acetyltransferase